ncbi:DUF3592 domain-containing protein [Uliginosibacterium sp. 31-16]|uniref:DUF3592 domain-containing protein n=1 Tax=Uliginosibacterium sp. 31-16 TaxID=3068315 RepID=UPI00273EB43D|nr:DUF3592 domain-containing protein [Uliginosibacterium sp. 31-16]MDP5241313.1 DUF3592 domain-containing protein [Uliginosibacterium sp. 31-16]
MNNPLRLFQFIFGGIGVLLLAVAMLWFASTRSFVNGAQHVPGVVVQLEISRGDDSDVYYPIIGFQSLDGREHVFRSSSGSNPPSYDQGEDVEVLYDPANPDKASINGFFALWGVVLIMGSLGLLFFAIGAGIWFAAWRSGSSAANLRESGQAVQAEFLRVEEIGHLEVNGRNPWRLVAQWLNPQTGKLHVFYSENLWFDPAAHIHQKHVRVFIDPANPKRYSVDTSFLPELAE